MFIIKKVVMGEDPEKELIIDVAIADTEQDAKLYMLKHQPLNDEVKYSENGTRYPYYFYKNVDRYDPDLDDDIDTIDSDHVYIKGDEYAYRDIQPSLLTIQENMGIEIDGDTIKTYSKSDLNPMYNRHIFAYDLAEMVKVLDAINNKLDERREKDA